MKTFASVSALLFVVAVVPACGTEAELVGVESALTAGCVPAPLPLARATASSQQAGAFAPKYAIDGVSTTRWSSDKAAEQWLSLDLGKVVTVASLNINWQTAYSKSYVIESSADGLTGWKILAVAGATKAGVQSVNALALTRYVRIRSTQATTWGNVSIIDVQVLGTVDASCGNLLAGPWVFSSDDFDPPSFDVSTTYSISGNTIVFTYSGKQFLVSGAGVPTGAHFKQVVPAVVQGGRYRLRVDVTSYAGASTTVWWASLSGAASPTDYVTADGIGSAAIDFTVSSAPGATPTLELVNKPITVFPGAGVQDFTVTATLTKTN